jgi:hypothetical protein
VIAAREVTGELVLIRALAQGGQLDSLTFMALAVKIPPREYVTDADLA